MTEKLLLYRLAIRGNSDIRDAYRKVGRFFTSHTQCIYNTDQIGIDVWEDPTPAVMIHGRNTGSVAKKKNHNACRGRMAPKYLIICMLATGGD